MLKLSLKEGEYVNIGDNIRVVYAGGSGKKGRLMIDAPREMKASNVSVMLDTFHMNIEEESIGAAIREAGSLLGHFHTGECNRMVPGRGRTPWREIGEALRDINYDKTVVMEPFVMPGGTVGQNIKVWRDIVPDTSEEALDRDAKKALEFERYMLG